MDFIVADLKTGSVPSVSRALLMKVYLYMEPDSAEQEVMLQFINTLKGPPQWCCMLGQKDGTAPGWKCATDIALCAILIAPGGNSKRCPQLVEMEQRGMLVSPYYEEVQLALEKILNQGMELALQEREGQIVEFVAILNNGIDLVDAWNRSDKAWSGHVARILAQGLGDAATNIFKFLLAEPEAASIAASVASPSETVDGQVIQHVDHEEEAAIIDAEVARTSTEIEWVSHVEMGVASSSNATPGVLLLRYGNAPKTSAGWRAFEGALLHGTPLRACRDAMVAHGCAIELESRAKVFCAPQDYATVLEVTAHEELHAFHVLVTPDFEPALQETLASLTYNLRPREKRQHRREFPFSPVDDRQFETEPDWPDVPEVTRTFLHFNFRGMRYRPTTGAPSVVQSTNDGHCDGHSRPLNPRRLHPPAMSED